MEQVREEEAVWLAHVTEALWAPVEALFGKPEVRHWRYPILDREMQMVVSSTRGQTRLHDVTILAFNRQGELALIRKHGYPPGAWRAPGGGINPGEAFVEGAAREALEETGLRVTVTRYLLRVFVTFTCNGVEQPWTTHVVVAESDDPEPAVGDPKEIAGVRWGTLDELCGPIAAVMLATGTGLFAYRVALHREIRDLLKGS